MRAKLLEREIERLRRERRIPRSLTLAELVETYLAQHDRAGGDDQQAALAARQGDRGVRRSPDRRVDLARNRGVADDAPVGPSLRGDAGAAAGAASRGRLRMLDSNPAKVGVDNPVPRRKEQRPFESWAELEALAEAIGPRYGPMITFAAATGLRPAEWVALEKRDVDREGRVVYVRRSFTRGQLKRPKTEASMRAVPLQARALDALDRLPASNRSPLLFPGDRGGYLDIHHFRPFQWRPAQVAAGVKPLRRVYDLRHTFATFALRAGISTFDLSRYMGASHDHRPPLRAPCTRRTRACDPAARRAQRA